MFVSFSDPSKYRLFICRPIFKPKARKGRSKPPALLLRLQALAHGFLEGVHKAFISQCIYHGLSGAQRTGLIGCHLWIEDLKETPQVASPKDVIDVIPKWGPGETTEIVDVWGSSRINPRSNSYKNAWGKGIYMSHLR